MALTRNQKNELARKVIMRAADIIEFWGEMHNDLPDDSSLRGVSTDDVREQIAVWMNALPGDAWDRRLDA